MALPVDEPAGTIAVRLPAAVASVDMLPDAETGEIISPLLAFLTHASLEAGDNQAQAGPGCRAADDHPRLQGPGVQQRVS